jgi:hypothetical protein
MRHFTYREIGSPYNEYEFFRENRWSVVFVGDIETHVACEGINVSRSRWFTMTMIHELGHQRGGLTDAGESAETDVYHDPGDDYWDVMGFGGPQLGYMQTNGPFDFCRRGSASVFDSNTDHCSGNLYRNRQVP